MFIVEIKKLNFGYEDVSGRTARHRNILHDISLGIPTGQFCALVGPTGSGKSSLLQLLAGLIPATSGTVRVCGYDLNHKRNRAELWRDVGIVFQFPEKQLFEENVADDVAFGLRNAGLPEKMVSMRVKQALEAVDLPAELAKISPFTLSGGQQRRAAIAGVLAMGPKLLLLDEPTAGLDPVGRRNLMQLFRELHRQGTTILLVSHNLEDVAAVAERVIVMHQGHIWLDGSPRQVFAQGDKLREIGLGQPFAADLTGQLKGRGLPVRDDILTVPEAVPEISKLLKHATHSARNRT